MAQTEAALHFLPRPLISKPAIPAARSNSDETMAPHGVFPAAGTDRWVAIAVRNDHEWQRLCRRTPLAELADDPALATLAGATE
jgi:crotonobetainyl-CoA:carnitine CoA-transferase CaiB-like acyl-CoA transferase